VPAVSEMLQTPNEFRKTGVLFLSSAEEPGADTFIHTLIMRYLDRSRFDVHVAYSADRPDARTPAFVEDSEPALATVQFRTLAVRPVRPR